MSDVLKKPVHLALLKPTHIDNLAKEKKIKPTEFGINPNSVKAPLPVEEKPRVNLFPKLNIPTNDLVKKSKNQIKLQVLYSRLPPIPEDKKPPCERCKTAACCTVFVVNLTELEYESGLYGDAAVKITPEIFDQLKSRQLQVEMLTAPRNTSNTQYLLEGKMGEPCPFLDQNNRCGIYATRPAVCRQYTCVGDPRITEAMRDGSAPIDAVSQLIRTRGTDDK